MGDLTKNLSRSEFACKCGCGHDTVDFELVMVIQDCADHFGASVYINSGCRCPDHNKAEGGSPGSWHVLGRAADFRVAGVHADKVATYLELKYPTTFGIGRYDGRTHVDTRKVAARWDKRTNKSRM
jgi:uncharacterized protein YcbK (DUF882 family)